MYAIYEPQCADSHTRRFPLTRRAKGARIAAKKRLDNVNFAARLLRGIWDLPRRRQYDSYGFAGVSGYSHEDLFGGLDPGSIFGDTGGLDFGTSFFDRMFGHRPRAGPRKGTNIEVALEVPLQRILTGGEETVRVKRPQTCQSCEGTGAKAGTKPRQCDACSGTGQHAASRQQGAIRYQQITTCQTCRGRG